MKTTLVSITCAFVILAATLNSCEKEEPQKAEFATVLTLNVNSITSSSAMSGGYVIIDGDSPITNRGVCWSTMPNFRLSDGHTSDDDCGAGCFYTDITGLQPGTTYYVRAYAKNSAGTAYGQEISFKTDR